ncbi:MULTISPECIES: VOC family protein [unclassified Roseibium]|uniref:VOC family protein n=1 Tax=unclassified Roseibium TaxID=2629323 RepID=UPI00273E3E3E|nr:MULTISPECIES: VOC family protein [unclassified Roseibium]
MKQFISAVSLLVPDYDEGLEFYGNVLGFQLIEDTELEPGKRWVLVAPPGSTETRLLLAKVDGPEQQAAIGNQTGGRVFMFLTTDDFDRDYAAMSEKGGQFLEAPRREPYGTVAVFQDPFGNKWDLIQPA